MPNLKLRNSLEPGLGIYSLEQSRTSLWWALNIGLRNVTVILVKTCECQRIGMIDQCWKPNLAPLPGEPSSHLVVQWLPCRPSILEEQRSDFTEIGPSTEYGPALLSAQPSVNLNVYSLSHYPSQHCFWPNNSFSRQKKYSTGSHSWNSNPSYHLPHHLEATGLIESENSLLRTQHRASWETIPCKIGVPS